MADEAQSTGGNADRRWSRLFIPSFCAALAITLFVIFQITRVSESEPSAYADWSAVRPDIRFKSFEARPPSAEIFRLAFLGDSTVGPYVGDQRLSRYVRFFLKQPPRIASDVILADLGFVGAGIVTGYFFADRVIDERPDLVVWEVSLLHFSDDWRGKIRTELAGWLGVGRLPEIFSLPLQQMGVRMDGLLMHQIVVRLGLLDVWADFAAHQASVRSMLTHARNRLASRPAFGAEKAFDDAIGYRRWVRMFGPRSRLTREGEEVVIGTSLDGLDDEDPTLRILRAALETYRAHDVPVLVYLTPVDVENIVAVGAGTEAGLDASARAIRSVVEATGARFLDLHDLYDDSAFAEWPHHYILDEEQDAVRPLAEAIARDVRVFLEAAPAR